MNITEEQESKETKVSKAERIEILLSMVSVYLKGMKSKDITSKILIDKINKELKLNY